MKNLMYLFVVAILVIAGCAKDDTLFENPDNLELKKAKVPIPMKANCQAIWDEESDLISVDIPLGNGDVIVISNFSKLILSGTGTHLGKIDAEKSFYVAKSAVFFINDAGIPYLHIAGDGKVVGANGDSFEAIYWTDQSLVDNTWFGVMEITPGTGTGKFKGCSGTCDILDGRSDNNGTYFKLDGYLVFE